MKGIQDILVGAKKAPGKRFIFGCAFKDKVGLAFEAERKGNGKTIAARLAKELGGTPAAWGELQLTDGTLTFFCSTKKSEFKSATIKKSLGGKTVDIDIRDLADADAQIADGAADPDAHLVDDRDMVRLWQKDLKKSLWIALKSEAKRVNEPLLPLTLNRISVPQATYHVDIPAAYMRILRDKKAVIAAQKLVDELNAEFSTFLDTVAPYILNDAPYVNPVLAGETTKLETTFEKVVAKHWAAFQKRYEVAGSYSVKKWITVGGIVLGGTAAVTGAATSAGNPVSLVPAAIAAARSLSAAVDAYRLHFEKFATVASSMEASAKSLKDSYADARGNADATPDPTEYGKIVLNKLATGEFLKTLPGLQSDITTVEGRLAAIEVSQEKMVAKLSALVDHVTSMDKSYREFLRGDTSKIDLNAAKKFKDKIDKLGAATDKGFAPIIAKVGKATEARKKLDNATKIASTLEKALGTTASDLKKFDTAVGALFAITTFVTNLATGAATASNEIGGVATGIGALVDGIDGVRLVTG